MSQCSLCNRYLEMETDPLSEDCGGDCLGCMIEVEGSDCWDEITIKFRNRIIELEKTTRKLLLEIQ